MCPGKWGNSITSLAVPHMEGEFFAWCLFGGVCQIAGTALLLRTMEERNFAVGVAYSKTEVVQVALFSLVLLGDTLNYQGILAVAAGTVGVLLLAPANKDRPFRSLIERFASRSALLGVGCGACMGLGTIAFRGATHALHSSSFLLNAAVTLVVAQTLQKRWLRWFRQKKWFR